MPTSFDNKFSTFISPGLLFWQSTHTRDAADKLAWIRGRARNGTIDQSALEESFIHAEERRVLKQTSP